MSVVAAAFDLRRRFELRSLDSELLAELYGAYNPDVDADRFVARALEIFPTGCCGLASLVLAWELGHGEVLAATYGDQRHTVLWLGQVADLTADQYGGPPVYVGPAVRPYGLGSRG